MHADQITDEQKPVAWRREWNFKGRPCAVEFTDSPDLAEQWRTHPQTDRVTPLYTAPPAPVAAPASPVAVKVPESNDELAQMVEDFHRGSVAFADDPDFHHLIEFTPPRLRDFLSALSDAPAREGWRSMDSAPKDGTPFIAAQGEWIYRCQWLRDEPDEGALREGWFDLENMSFEEPTHWLPYEALPPLPTASPTGEDA